ncbi:MAG: D-alanine--D-alanine ligase [endosymbiont of Seepiophila jonesi]|uniref:D-alanine--D-alanine ligase n=1 Tax=endosymbiont of Lamellibrachia luymesi TaxID=2200907 RepID=A0A370E165_9GAMM|nr:MAG: D-alanine--D-alanine ligase [endosymbiont of Seepiophila jonesi]RDH92524.1 MAG: D-alanine--D-alanine ligase [endosymbiont of Lamellibrachia luymesi]
MKPNVGVFFGGRSVEHEVSIISGLQVVHAIDADLYRVTPVYISKTGEWYIGEKLFEIDNFKQLETLLSESTEVMPHGDGGQLELYRVPPARLKNNLIEKLDIVFPVIHGTNGEDGTLQGLLEMAGVPYAGCDVSASVIGMDKILTKTLLRGNGIPVVESESCRMEAWYQDRRAIIDRIQSKLGYPVVVKPANLGSSIGISVAASEAELEEAIENAGQYDPSILVERMVTRLKEINASVLGNRDESEVAALEEPLRSSGILNFADKYQGGKTKGISSTDRVLPAEIPGELADRIRRLAKETFSLIGASGVVRIDFLVDEESGDVFVNEINTIPGSLAFYLWEASGVSFAELTTRVIKLALERFREKGKRTYVFDSNLLSLQGSGGKLGSKR